MSENTHLDLKSTLNPSNKRDMLELVKDLVAMANSGGGTIRIGATELATPGIQKELAPQFDGAKISDQINRFIHPAKASVSHAVREIAPDHVIVELSIAPAGKYPYVFSKQGQYDSAERPVFRPGEIYVRHGAKSEPITYADIVEIIDRATAQSKEELYQRIGQLVRLPEGFDVVFVTTPSGDVVLSPATLIDLTNRRRETDRSAMLDGRELLWCFSRRNEFEMTRERHSLLIRSALRRAPTLYFWLESAPDDEFVEEILLSSLEDSDRDKSDAKSTLLEVGALFASDTVLETLVSRMRKSTYAHFKRAAQRWKGRQESIDAFVAATNAEVNGKQLRIMSSSDLYAHAEAIANRLLSTMKKPIAEARLMSNIGRELLRRRRGL